MSAETLNFGPQWLRDLSSGSNVTSPPPSPATQPIMKFKLAQHRYGREEMLALFEKSDYVPPELLHAPNIISEDALIPLSLIPLTEEDQRAFSGGVNSEVYRRSRGTRGSIPSGRGRSIPTRGRGRGRGELFSRSMSQNDEGPPFGRGSREFGRRESWDDRGFNRNGRSFDDAPRKPIRRSDASDDWRNDAVRGSGDGADNEKDGASDWRPAAPSRKDGWREPSRGSWRDSGEERGGWNNDSFQRDRRSVNRTRSYGGPSKYESESGLMPEWADDADDNEVGVFDSSGAFQSTQKRGGKRTIDGTRDSDRGIRRNASSFGSLRKIEEKEKDKSERGETSKKGDVLSIDEKPDSGENEKQTGVAAQEDVTVETTPSEESSNQEAKKEIQKTPESPAKEPPKEVEKKVDKLSEVGERAAENGSEHEEPAAQLSSKDTVKQPPEEEVDHMIHHEMNALKLIDSLTEFEDKTPIADPTVPLPTRLPPALDPMTLLQGSATPNVPDLAMKWFYKDPQGETQGPFSSQEMGEWFMAGYFTSTLLVKRACDPQFVPLGDLITRCGAVPFVPQSLPQTTNSDVMKAQKQAELIKQQQQQMQLQMQMQKQQQLQQLQQQQQYQQQQQLIQQQKQQQILREFQQKQHQQAAYANIVSQLSSSEEFLAMSTQQQQATVAQYLALVQQQPTPTDTPTTSQSIWDDDPTILRRPSPVPMATTQQQQQLVERLKQQEQSAAAKKKQEEEEEKAQREKEEMQRLQQAQEEARRLKMEELHKQHLMEEMQRQAELQRAKEEEETAQREQEERRLKEEQRRQEEEAKARAAIAKLQEEEREEEEARRREEERIRRGVMEEEKRKKQAQEEHEKRLLHLKMVEEERRKRLQEEKAQEEALKRQKELEAQRLKEEAQRKKQQEQLKNIKLPTTANWAEQQSTQQLHQQQQQMSVSEIQKLQERKEQERLLQEQQMRAISQRQQQQQQRGVWGASPTSYTAATPPTPSTMSLMEIQMEESRNQSKGQAKQPQPKPELSLQAAVAWGGRTNPSSTGVWGNQGYQAPTQPTYWEQAPKAVTRKPAQPNNTRAPAQQQKTRAKQKTNNTSNENNTVLAHFQKQQTAAQSDPFVSWCVTEMRKLPTSADLDITTFVGFLRDLESPDEVKGYITSYLGDSKPARDFAEAFLQRRLAAKKQQRLEEQKQQEKQKQQQQQQQQAKKQQQATQAKPTTDQEVVTGSTKRGKRKQKKLQKVDPSILGFSVNAASGRVNMGEIDTPNDG